MMILLLGLLDVFFAVMMLLTHLEVLHSWRIALMAAIFWIGKAAIFRGGFLSALDFLAGLYFVFVMFSLHTPIVYIFLGVMVYKFMLGFMMRG